MQHYPHFQCLISNPGGCFVSNELREWAGVRGIGLLTAPGEFHGLTADLENLIRVIKRLARNLADGHPDLTLASCVSLACFSHMVSRLEGTRRFDGRLAAMNRHLQKQARDAISRAQHTTRKESVDLEPGTWVMYFRRGKVTRGAIDAPSKSGLWLGPARVIITEAVQQWSGSVHSTTGQIGVVWVSHGNKLIRCHPTQLRRCSEREVSIASVKGLVQVSMPTSVTELTNSLSPGQYEDLSTSLPTRDDLRFGEVDLEAPPVDQETMAPSFVPLFPSGTVVAPSQNTSTRLSSIPNPVSASAGRESDVQVDESSLTPGSIQISPRELTRSQGELARSSMENAHPVTERFRIVGKRTITSTAPLAFPDNVDSASVPESLPEADLREVLEPFEGDTKKRRVESFDESVDWFQKERSSIAWWLSKRLSDGKSKHPKLVTQENRSDEILRPILIWSITRCVEMEGWKNLTDCSAVFCGSSVSARTDPLFLRAVFHEAVQLQRPPPLDQARAPAQRRPPSAAETHRRRTPAQPGLIAGLDRDHNKDHLFQVTERSAPVTQEIKQVDMRLDALDAATEKEFFRHA